MQLVRKAPVCSLNSGTYALCKVRCWLAVGISASRLSRRPSPASDRMCAAHMLFALKLLTQLSHMGDWVQDYLLKGSAVVHAVL